MATEQGTKKPTDPVSNQRRRRRRLPVATTAASTMGCFLLVASYYCSSGSSSTTTTTGLLDPEVVVNHRRKVLLDSSSAFQWFSRRVEEDDRQEDASEEEDANEEDDEEEEDEEEDDEEEEDEEEEEDDDGQQQQNNNNNDDLNNDDYFDDRLHDDLVAADDELYIDDFYAFEDDPGPPQLFPLTGRTILGFSTATMALSLGATGGIGGGGILVPIYTLVMGLPLKVAIPIGAVTVLGGALACTVLNWPRRHPLADRPLVDWDAILIMEPLVFFGMLVGTLFHRLFSEKLLIVLLVLLLTATAHSTLSKAMRMYRAEKRYLRYIRTSQSTVESPPSFPKTNTWQEVDSHIKGQMSPRKLNAEEKQQILIVNPDFVTLRSDLIEQEKFTPRGKIIACFAIFGVVVFLNIMAGGGAYQSPWDITCGSPAFWSIHAIMIAFLIASAWVAQTYVVARHEIKELVRFDYVHGDIKWDARSSIIYPALFTSAGFFAGTLGIGGGVITVPIMLTMGVHPAVVSATSSAMILFTSLGATSSYLVFGLILKDFAIAGFFIGFFAALTGHSLMRQARQVTGPSGRKFERNSFLTFAVGGIVLISALLMTIQYVLKTIQEPEEDDGGLCDGLRF